MHRRHCTNVGNQYWNCIPLLGRRPGSAHRSFFQLSAFPTHLSVISSEFRHEDDVLCHDSTYGNKSSTGSPLIDYGFRMIDGQTAGYYTLTTGQRKTLISYGTCAFSDELVSLNGGIIPGTGAPLCLVGVGLRM